MKGKAMPPANRASTVQIKISCGCVATFEYHSPNLWRPCGAMLCHSHADGADDYRELAKVGTMRNCVQAFYSVTLKPWHDAVKRRHKRELGK